ncbi:hypothetical protein GCM10009654_02900 [Streptomyces hebeiensis]|uniref:Uncharacterized protein n=1 Tax=Streptomyces hebeiensis TaxID=229486 RepID=A0ABN1UGR4_9ACTN
MLFAPMLAEPASTNVSVFRLSERGGVQGAHVPAVVEPQVLGQPLVERRRGLHDGVHLSVGADGQVDASTLK